MADCEVLICGAGPTGLVLGLWLTRQGVKVRIIDKAAEPGTTSRALAVQARTLELYRQADLAEEVTSLGHKTMGAHLWVQGRQVARISFGEIGEGQSPAPFFLIYPQDEHERLLIDHLRGLGVAVERPTELVAFTQKASGIEARLRTPDGEEETVHAAYLAGCDGAHSAVRHGLGIQFHGAAYDRMFYVADVEASGPPVNGDLNVDLDDADFLALFPLKREGHVRLIGTVQENRVADIRKLTFNDVSERAIKLMHLDVTQVNWFSAYHVHHRVADRFVQGRAFLLGDAAHIHSPVGGQGMNTGIGDAINLAWKLTAVLRGQALPDLLETYQTERMAFAQRLVATTDRGFTFITADGPLAQFVRTKVTPLVLPPLVHGAQDLLFRTVGQLNLNYRTSPLSEGRAGHVHGGDRLPWIEVGEADNFAPLETIAWQGQVYGEAAVEVRDWFATRGLRLEVYGWTDATKEAGLTRDALYLMRPDSYVALVERQPTAARLDAYFSERGLRPSA